MSLAATATTEEPRLYLVTFWSQEWFSRARRGKTAEPTFKVGEQLDDGLI